MWQEFKAFLFKQNVLALAIAVVVGAATNDLVQAIVQQFIMPLVALITPSSIEWEELAFQVGGSTFGYGLVIAAFINLVIVAFVVWRVSKALIKEPPAPEGPAMKDCPFCLQKIDARATRCAFCTSEVAAA